MSESRQLICFLLLVWIAGADLMSLAAAGEGKAAYDRARAASDAFDPFTHAKEQNG